MLISLLRERLLRPYGRLLLGVLVLQLVGTLASLYLPSLNAAIIDKGVLTGDTAFILHTGKIMLVVSLVQIICAVFATYLGARAAMGFGRDVRGAVFERVLSFSARELNHFGAPTLITRTTNDVQQVQLLALLVVDRVRRGADHHDRRRDHGPARGRRAVLADHRGRAGAGRFDRAADLEDAAAVPGRADPDRHREPGAARADHRHPRGARLRPRAVRGRRGSAGPTPSSPRPRPRSVATRPPCSRSSCWC